jgi:hypothetical protein
MDDELFGLFHRYLEERRRALLTELDEIERQLGTSPRTAEIRRKFNGHKIILSPQNGDDLAGAVTYQD